MGSAMRRMIAIAALGAMASCTALSRNHGYVPNDDALAGLTVGTDSQVEVAAAVGRPVSTGILAESGWYYVQSRFESFAWRAPREVDREVVAISFDDAGVVTNIERFGLEQGRVVILSRRVTESRVRGIGFLRQLFGNIGNFDIADFVDN